MHQIMTRNVYTVERLLIDGKWILWRIYTTRAEATAEVDRLLASSVYARPEYSRVMERCQLRTAGADAQRVHTIPADSRR